MTQTNVESESMFIAPDLFSILRHEETIEAGIQSGALPFDTYLRLRAIGQCEVDPQDGKTRLAFNIAGDIADHIDEPDAMRPDTRQLLWGERPDAIVDWEQYTNRKAYTALDVMYYRMANLAGTIKRHRKETGSTVIEVPHDWYTTPERLENARCLGLARPIWRVIVQRIHPEWLAEPDRFLSRSQRSVWGATHELGDRTMRRYIVGAAVISDEVVFDIYDEAKRTGVKGIGPRGRESLRELLADEHPELY